MSIHSSAPLAMASMALGIGFGTALTISASHHAPCPAVTVVPTPVIISPNSVVTTPPAQAALQGLRPANAGQPVSQGSRVLARWYDDTWWEATVASVGQGTVTVAWADGSPPDQLPASDVANLPAQPEPVAVGSHALCSWRSSTRWWRARVVDHGGAATIEYIDGDSALLSAERCVLASFAD